MYVCISRGLKQSELNWNIKNSVNWTLVDTDFVLKARAMEIY